MHTSPLAQPGTGDGGGLNVYVLSVARRLAERGVEVDVFTRSASPAAPPTVEVTPRLRVHHLVAGPQRPVDKQSLGEHVPAFAMAMLRHETAGCFDVIHAHYWLSGWVAKLVSERWATPYVVTFHTLGVVKNQTLAPGDEPEPATRVSSEPRIARYADQVVGLTCGEARLLHRTFDISGRHISVVPAGVDLDLFQPGGPVSDLAPGTGPLLLFVGRLQPLKGPDVAIRTLAHVRERYPDARLLIVGGVSGSGEGRSGPSELADLAVSLGVQEAITVRPALPQSELAAVYRAADVVVVPSRTESFGLVALEAEACARPVVAARVGGLQSVVRGGTLVDGHDPVDHAAAVLRYLDDPAHARAAGERGRAAAVGTSWDRTVDGLLGVYRTVTARPEVLRTG